MNIYSHALDDVSEDFPYSVIVKTDHIIRSLDNVSEKMSWCETQKIHVAWIKPHLSEYDYVQRTFYFANESDAIRFKLFWSMK
jgi:hypothetical protein